VGMSHSIIRS